MYVNQIHNYQIVQYRQEKPLIKYTSTINNRLPSNRVPSVQLCIYLFQRLHTFQPARNYHTTLAQDKVASGDGFAVFHFAYSLSLWWL